MWLHGERPASYAKAQRSVPSTINKKGILASDLYLALQSQNNGDLELHHNEQNFLFFLSLH